jgi:hypothetical protein
VAELHVPGGEAKHAVTPPIRIGMVPHHPAVPPP